jgi:fucose 4-O-acetylase-like acetyltransferase
MGTIFLFHSSAPFSYFPWNINDPTPNLGFTVFGLFLLGWAMPLFFVISGISAYFSLARRSASQFVRDRLERLMIPFVFVGLLVVLSVNGYYDAVFHGNFAEILCTSTLGRTSPSSFPSTQISHLRILQIQIRGFTSGIFSDYSHSPSSQFTSSSGL